MKEQLCDAQLVLFHTHVCSRVRLAIAMTLLLTTMLGQRTNVGDRVTLFKSCWSNVCFWPALSNGAGGWIMADVQTTKPTQWVVWLKDQICPSKKVTLIMSVKITNNVKHDEWKT